MTDFQNGEERVRELEEKERALNIQTIEGARAGAVSPALRRELDEVRAQLKVARRVRAMDAKRTDPKLTRKVTILLPEEEFQTLTKKATEGGVDLSKYIRMLLKKQP
jgi:predicted DNA binding CopG/RHH family protein